MAPPAATWRYDRIVKKVRETLSLVISANPVVQPRKPVTKPVVAHLRRVFDLAANASMAGMGRALECASNDLTWEYGYERIPSHLSKKYAYCETLGPSGPVVSERLTLGFVLFAPRTT